DAVQAHLDHGDSLGTCTGAGCPCWNESDLLAVTAENESHYGREDGSCALTSQVHGIEDTAGDFFFVSGAGNKPPFCLARSFSAPISSKEWEVCSLQISNRCAAIGTPQIPF